MTEAHRPLRPCAAGLRCLRSWLVCGLGVLGLWGAYGVGAEPIPPTAYAPVAASSKAAPVVQKGLASVYANRLHGRLTASGEPYDRNGLVAAHRRLPFGTLVTVRSVRTGREVTVRIVDRGPHVKGRILDLSAQAAKALGHRSGVFPVRVVQVLTPDAMADAADSRAD